MEEKNIHEINELALEGIEISINLEDQQIIAQNKIYKFEIDPYRKHCLLNGLDDIGITLETEDKINLYEDKLNNKKWHVPDKI